MRYHKAVGFGMCGLWLGLGQWIIETVSLPSSSILHQIKNQIKSPQHKCLGEWNSYERAPDSAEKQQTITISDTGDKSHCQPVGATATTLSAFPHAALSDYLHFLRTLRISWMLMRAYFYRVLARQLLWDCPYPHLPLAHTCLWYENECE